MNLLTLNTLSSENINTKEEVNELLLQLVYGIKKFLSYEEYRGSRFYTEESDILNFEIITDYKFKDAMLSLKREILDFFYYFIDHNCDNNCLAKITDMEMENIINSDLYFDNEEFDGQKYIILSYSLEKKTFLLSFGKNRWNNYKVIAKKLQENGSSEPVILNNIANKEHAITHYQNQQFNKLPQDNVFYSQEFKNNFISKNYSTITKIIEKIKEAENNQFNIDGFLVKSIDSEIWQIKIGTQGGLQQSAIRVLFRKEDSNIYIVHMFTKQGGTNYDYTSDISIAKENYTKLRQENS